MNAQSEMLADKENGELQLLNEIDELKAHIGVLITRYNKLRAALVRLDDELNETCIECGCDDGHLSGCTIGIARWGEGGAK